MSTTSPYKPLSRTLCCRRGTQIRLLQRLSFMQPAKPQRLLRMRGMNRLSRICSGFNHNIIRLPQLTCKSALMSFIQLMTRAMAIKMIHQPQRHSSHSQRLSCLRKRIRSRLKSISNKSNLQENPRLLTRSAVMRKLKR